MKPFLSTDVTFRPDNDVINGREFISATVNETINANYEMNQQKSNELIESAKMPLALRLLKPFCGALFFIMLLAIFGDCNVAAVWEQSPLYFIIAPLCLIIWIVLIIAEKKRVKGVLESDEARQVSEALETSINDSYISLGVPDDASAIEVLMFRYKSVNGEVTPQGIGAYSFVNLITKMYKKDDCFCVADIVNAYSIPLSSIKRIVKVSKKSLLPYWHKSDDLKSDKYKPYGLKIDSKTGGFFINDYYILCFEHGGENWGLYFPPYDLEEIIKLTGAPVTEDLKEPVEVKDEAPAEPTEVKEETAAEPVEVKEEAAAEPAEAKEEAPAEPAEAQEEIKEENTNE
jgi:hypothetical protein